MKQNFDIAIIGGGASGLFCACMIKSKAPDLSVAIIEKQSSTGKKLLATGNGRCNLTNIYATPQMYHGSFSANTDKLLRVCSPDLILEIFEEMGLLTTTDSEGRVYPLSKQSSTVLDLLLLSCLKHKTEIFCDAKVKDIKKDNDLYNILTDNISLTAKRVIIATGSKATPETGADDSIYAVLTKLGHTITPLVPALCPVKVKSKILNTLKGVRVQGEVSIVKDGNTLKTEQGEIQFTDKTLSGICVFNLSRIANTLDDSELSVSLLPEKNKYTIKEMLKSRTHSLLDDASAYNILTGMFNRKICTALMRCADIDSSKTISEITDKDINTITSLINNWKFKVIKSDDFSRAQVVAGGVTGSEIHPDTMESKINKNMYIIGEAVDCDGDCGGLNLQFAFSSAYIAACDIANDYN